MRLVLLVHVAATLIMFGVILVVQIVHYPLFGRVGQDGYVGYQRAHMRLISWVVVPPMLAELATALWLVLSPPAGLPAWSLWLGLALVGGIWLSTALLQAPTHGRLLDGFDAAQHRRLVATNWIRTAAWGARAVLVLWFVARLLDRA